MTEPTAANAPIPEASVSLHGSEHKTYYPALDGLRALAVVMVFMQHYFNMPFGFAGVDVFFVLSGFLITGILWKTRRNEHRYRTFYLRRTLRIFPAYYATFLVLLLITPVFHLQWRREHLSWLVYLGNWSAYIHMLRFGDYSWGTIPGTLWVWGHSYPVISIRHFWSLCLEEQFYLVWPFLAYFLRGRRRIMAVSIFFVFGIPVFRRVSMAFLPHILLERRILYYLTIYRVDALMMGALIAMALLGAEGKYFRKAAPWVLPLSILTLGIPFFISRHLYGTAHIQYLEGWMNVFGFSVFDVAAAALVILALNPASRTYRIFSGPRMRWLGMRSYGFYIYHEILRAFLDPLLKLHYGMLLRGVAGMAISLILCWLSFRYLETPFLRLKDKYA